MSTALDGAEGARTPCPSCENPFSIDLNQAVSEDSAADDSTLVVSSPRNRKKGDEADYEVGPSLKDLPHVNSGSILKRIVSTTCGIIK